MTAAGSPTETVTDMMDPARGRALQVALGLAPTIEAGTPLPPFFHQVHFWEPQPPVALGRDGHPRVGGLVPDLGLPRRMWAGGDLSFHAPLLAGVPAEKRARCTSVTRKTGRSGPLAFVSLLHEIRQEGRLRVEERQDLVYREDPDPAAPAPVPPEARTDEAEAVEETFDSTLLFRYSALTFNGHRIHYDADYARTVEGYAGLVVHGPLLAQRLMLMAAGQGGLARFRFRATAPVISGERVSFCRSGTALWVRGADGRLCMQAEAA
ncbi:hypothetical protein [Salipiger mucosus]|uniref:N-terminal of MaoC-like dehydratase domain-containing protein n=1 Tax=Salipiger mucosus DSM 16094 TaxID=1123237 RepID=S9QRQ5_9RHOB|nr:hypothetical protein [Salipiger mucosus]EPX82328.1 hypothetical protein Salmuc_04053 [Salipiger mucosus DSM 16094]